LQAVPAIIQGLKAKGFRFVTVDDLIRRQPATAVTETLNQADRSPAKYPVAVAD